MKRVLFTAVLLIALFVMVACGRSREEPEPTPTAIPAAEEAPVEEAVEEATSEGSSEPDRESEEVVEEEADAGEASESDGAAEADGDADDGAAEEDSVAKEGVEDEVSVEESAEDEEAEETSADAENAEGSAESDDGAVAAEGDEAESAQGLGSMITVLLNDLFFGETNDNLANPPTWTVTSGEEVSLAMQNLSVAVKHNWAVVKQGAEISVPYNAETDAESLLYESGLVDAESETELTFTAPGVGEYLVICTEPGHSVLMQGKLVVE